MQSVLIVDDSATARLALRHAIEQDAELYVIGEADSGDEALSLAKRLRPSVITMDVLLRRENGIDIAAAIMADAPCPIVIVTGCDTSDRNLVYQALQVGALEIIPKLPGPFTPEYTDRVSTLNRLLRNMAKVPVVTRRKRETTPTGDATAATRTARASLSAAAPACAVRPSGPQLVVIGASTGGPPLIRDLLGSLSRKPSVPIAVAQHITRGFGRGFAEWLKDATGQNTIYVDKPMLFIPGNIYIAPDDADLAFEGRLNGSPRPSASGSGVPSVDVLFMTAAARLGSAVISLLMTGMGKDGAAGTGALAHAGAITLVQDPKTCVVSSMPEAALRAAPESTIVTPAHFPKIIERLVMGTSNS